MKKTTFDTIYDTYSKKMFNYALWLTRNKDACHDILQSVFIKLWDSQKYFMEESELEAWLYTVTRNACMDFFRRCSRFHRFRVKYAEESPVYADEPQQYRALWEMLDTLQEKERSILYLHFRTGYSYRYIADILEMKETAVRVTAFRALGKLRVLYGKDML